MMVGLTDTPAGYLSAVNVLALIPADVATLLNPNAVNAARKRSAVYTIDIIRS
jgi:hypothetical protein